MPLKYFLILLSVVLFAAAVTAALAPSGALSPLALLLTLGAVAALRWQNRTKP